jgi:hypothetical protein
MSEPTSAICIASFNRSACRGVAFGTPGLHPAWHIDYTMAQYQLCDPVTCKFPNFVRNREHP